MSKTYETTDIYLAAYLRLEGIRYLGHREMDHRTIFMFQEDELLVSFIEAYNRGTARVSPLMLRDNVRDIKSMVNRSKEGPEPI